MESMAFGRPARMSLREPPRSGRRTQCRRAVGNGRSLQTSALELTSLLDEREREREIVDSLRAGQRLCRSGSHKSSATEPARGAIMHSKLRRSKPADPMEVKLRGVAIKLVYCCARPAARIRSPPSRSRWSAFGSRRAAAAAAAVGALNGARGVRDMRGRHLAAC